LPDETAQDVMSSSGEGRARTVRLAIQARTIFLIPIWIADHKGFFEEEGIRTDIEIISNGEQIKQRLQSRDIQIALASPEIVLIEAYARGALRIVGNSVRKPPLFMIAQPRIRTLSALRGAVIGVLSLQEGSSKLIRILATSAGLGPSDYTLSPVGGAETRWKLLQEGKIDAGLQPVPLSYEAEAAGFNNLGWTGTYEPDWPFSTLITNGDWARQNSPIVTAFLRAMLRAQQYIFSNPDDAARIAAMELHTPLPLAARAIADSTRLGIFDPQLAWSEAGMARIFEHLQADGIIPADQHFSIGSFVEEEYLRKAQSSLRRQ
jgi:ABC-type nitrate/sulfonate/bicarbonate transport system substrate-binding protein